MANYDGSIRVDTRIDSSGFNKGVQGLVTGLKGLAAAVGIAFGVAAIVNFGKQAVSTATEITNSLIGMKSVVDGQGRSWTEAKGFIDDYVKDGLVPLMNATTAYKNLALRGYSEDQIVKVMTALKNSAAFGRQSSLTLGYAVQSATEGLKNENSILVDNAGVTKNVSVMWKDYAAQIGVSVQNLTQAQKIEAEVAGIMTETRFQMGDAAKIAGTYSGMVSALNVSWTNFTSAVGNMVIPILKAIIPYIKAAIDWLTALANTLGRAIALFLGVKIDADDLAGSTASVANNTGTAAENAGDLAKNTGKAQKAAKGALAAFDEINVLQQQTPETGAGAGVAGAPGLGLPNPKETNSVLDQLKEKVEAFKQSLLEFFAPLAGPFERVKAEFMEIVNIVGGWISPIFENVLKPFGTWLIQQVAPRFLEIIAILLDFLGAVLKGIEPYVVWFYDNFLKPIAEWTGQAFIDFLDWVIVGLKLVVDAFKEDGILGAIVTLFMYIGLSLEAIAQDMINSILADWLKWVTNVNEGIIKPVFRFFSSLWETIKQLAYLAWWGIQEAWRSAASWFSTTVITPVSSWFQTAWTNIQNFASAAWEFIKSVWNGAYTWFKTWIIDPISTAFNTAVTSIRTAWETAFGGIRDFVKGVINSIIDFINAMLRAVGGGINGVINSLNSLKITIPSWVPVFGGQSWSMGIPAIAVPQIPRLATGAVIPPNAQFAAILGDNKSQREILAPEETIRQIVQEVMQDFAGGDFIVTMPVYLDGQKIYENQKRVQRRIGTSLIAGGTV